MLKFNYNYSTDTHLLFIVIFDIYTKVDYNNLRTTMIMKAMSEMNLTGAELFENKENQKELCKKVVEKMIDSDIEIDEEKETAEICCGEAFGQLIVSKEQAKQFKDIEEIIKFCTYSTIQSLEKEEEVAISRIEVNSINPDFEEENYPDMIFKIQKVISDFHKNFGNQK